MIRKKRTRLIGFFILSDIIAILISYFWSYLFRFYGYIIPVDPEKGIPSLKSYILVFPLFLVVHLVIFFFQGFYKTRLRRTKIDDFFFIALNAVFSILIILAILNYLYAYSQGPAPLFRMEFKISHLFLAIYFIAIIFMISVLRNQIYYVMKRRYAKGLNLQNVIIVGAGEMGKAVAQRIAQYKDLGFVARGFLDDEKKPGEKVEVDGGIEVLGPIEELETILERENISDVYVALDLTNYHKIMEIFKTVHRHMVNVRLIPDLFQLLTLKARLEDLDGFPVISIDEPPLRGFMRVIKRIMDVMVSAILLLLFSPLLLVVAALIKLTSKGPVIYRQERVGLDGRKFIMHKFRTMICDAEKKTGPVMCAPKDPRITKVGSFLRKFSIDEFPQLINVIKGEMSFVGPRPERPEFVKDFRDKYPKYMLRHKVKSGVTGWAQIHGLRQDTSIRKRIEYDFYYMQNWSIGLDLKIIWKTFRKGFIDKKLK